MSLAPRKATTTPPASRTASKEATDMAKLIDEKPAPTGVASTIPAAARNAAKKGSTTMAKPADTTTIPAESDEVIRDLNEETDAAADTSQGDDLFGGGDDTPEEGTMPDASPDTADTEADNAAGVIKPEGYDAAADEEAMKGMTDDEKADYLAGKLLSEKENEKLAALRLDQAEAEAVLSEAQTVLKAKQGTYDRQTDTKRKATAQAAVDKQEAVRNKAKDNLDQIIFKIGQLHDKADDKKAKQEKTKADRKEKQDTTTLEKAAENLLVYDTRLLTKKELGRIDELKVEFEAGFAMVTQGYERSTKAVQSMLDEKLYEGHASPREFLTETLGIGISQANRELLNAKVYGALELQFMKALPPSIHDETGKGLVVSEKVLPTAASQTRELNRAGTAEDQARVWNALVTEAKKTDGAITAKGIHDAVDKDLEDRGIGGSGNKSIPAVNTPTKQLTAPVGVATVTTAAPSKPTTAKAEAEPETLTEVLIANGVDYIEPSSWMDVKEARMGAHVARIEEIYPDAKSNDAVYDVSIGGGDKVRVYDELGAYQRACDMMKEVIDAEDAEFNG